MVVVRALAAVSAVAMVAVMAVGCGGGLSQADADVRCDQDKASLGSLYSADIYKQCEACFMECGDQCVLHATTPITYTCNSGGTGGTASTSSSSSSSSSG